MFKLAMILTYTCMTLGMKLRNKIPRTRYNIQDTLFSKSGPLEGMIQHIKDLLQNVIDGWVRVIMF
jgi:hypothetical protein